MLRFDLDRRIESQSLGCSGLISIDGLNLKGWESQRLIFVSRAKQRRRSSAVDFGGPLALQQRRERRRKGSVLPTVFADEEDQHACSVSALIAEDLKSAEERPSQRREPEDPSSICTTMVASENEEGEKHRCCGSVLPEQRRIRRTMTGFRNRSGHLLPFGLDFAEVSLCLGLQTRRGSG